MNVWQVGELLKQLLALPGFDSMEDDDEASEGGGSRGEGGRGGPRSPAVLQKTLDGWRDTADRVDVGLQCW